MCIIYCICVSCLCIVHADNFSRVLLEQQPGIDGSDYINASYIDVSLLVCDLTISTVLLQYIGQ